MKTVLHFLLYVKSDREDWSERFYFYLITLSVHWGLLRKGILHLDLNASKIQPWSYIFWQYVS